MTTKQTTTPAPRRFTQLLPCDLSPQDRLTIGSSMAAKLGEAAALQDEQKRTNESFKIRVNALDDEVRTLGKKLRDGYEDRVVECVEERVFETGTVRVRRVDTGTIVAERAMTLEERQMPLPGTDANPIEGEVVHDGGPPPRRGPPQGVKMLPQQAGQPGESTDVTDPQGMLDHMPPDPNAPPPKVARKRKPKAEPTKDGPPAKPTVRRRKKGGA